LTTTSITFEEDDKVTTADQVTVFDINTDFFINSSLYKSSDLQSGNRESDAFGISFSTNYTTIGSDEDAGKLPNPDENFAVVNNGLRSLDFQNMPTDAHEVELFTAGYTETNYSLTFRLDNQPADITAFVKDNYLNTQTEINSNTVYDFTIDGNIPESIASDRFSLVFNNTTLGVDDNKFGAGFNLYPNPSTNGLFNINTQGISGQKVEISIHNILGQAVLSQTPTVEGNGNIAIDASNLSTGVYMVGLNQNGKTFVSKLIIK
jgi:hypothetical protein